MMNRLIGLLLRQAVLGAYVVPGAAAKLATQTLRRPFPRGSQAAMLVAELTSSVSSCEKFSLHLAFLRASVQAVRRLAGTDIRFWRSLPFRVSAR